MSMPTEGYSSVIVETYSAIKAGKKSLIHARPIAGQGLDTEIDVECGHAMRASRPPGAKFKIRAKLIDREGGKPFLYSNYKWPYEVIE
ncbi:MAG: hypothetical protein JWS10_2338 [Cypionkella sp.]|uniref:hypothetical protein n=1 Tax=Cypionkella sp. TaxID=2811411 RepID=UPI00260CC499|nr:hypothetical protein [Cypionkella sp.]MDB5659723.1 hypothetical protein [Cypionkella sp.]